MGRNSRNKRHNYYTYKETISSDKENDKKVIKKQISIKKLPWGI